MTKDKESEIILSYVSAEHLKQEILKVTRIDIEKEDTADLYQLDLWFGNKPPQKDDLIGVDLTEKDFLSLLSKFCSIANTELSAHQKADLINKLTQP